MLHTFGIIAWSPELGTGDEIGFFPDKDLIK